MLNTVVKKKFTSGGVGAILNTLKTTAFAPLKHFKRNTEPTAQNYQTMTNTTEEAFDEVSHEWQTLLTHNAFDVNIFNYLENVQTSNFGTVDNPLVVFTSDLPFRYTGCTGPTNEDDYEGHELMFFMLREGSMQRCPSCGQVFKLVRLRNEYSPEMDYYYANFHTYDMQEMGESDTTHLMNPFKMNTHFEYTNHESPSNMVYSMVNPDQHDRMLIDPAYRMEYTKKIEQKMKVYVLSLKTVEKEFVQNNGFISKIPINKVDYGTLVDVELAIKYLDRKFRQVAKFNQRMFVDPLNHERREKRMNKRSAERWDNAYTFYVRGQNEEKKKFKDYFETEQEEFAEIEQYEAKFDQDEIYASEEYRLDRYDFQQMHTRGPEDDQTSVVEKMIFKFKYRQAGDPIEVFLKRQERMISRQKERLTTGQYQKLIDDIVAAESEKNEVITLIRQKRYFKYIWQEAVQLYKDYYEDDQSQDFSVLDDLPKLEQQSFAGVYENFCKVEQFTDSLEGVAISGFTFNASEYDPSSGFWVNFLNAYNDQKQLKPVAENLGNLIAQHHNSVLQESDEKWFKENKEEFEKLLDQEILKIEQDK